MEDAGRIYIVVYVIGRDSGYNYAR